MISEWDETPWSGTTVTEPASNVVRMIPAKAATGWEASYTSDRLPVSFATRSPLRRMREEQAAYWVNPWILTAENAVTRRVRGLPWHLEDGNDDTVDDEDHNPVLRTVRTLLEKPQVALPIQQRQIGIESWTNLISITSRHLGLCGMTHWYLDQMDSNGTPAAILYVNPARLWAQTTTTGQLVQWILDPKDEDGSGGVPLRREEVLTFYLTPPDGGAYVTGLVHAARIKSQVATAADYHALSVLASGGRIAGLISPKEGAIQDEQYAALTRELRNIQEAPDSAKRLTIIRGPVDFNATSSNMQELDLPGIASMNRNDIFTVWGVPPRMAGVEGQAAGLNSGETLKYEEAILMQGPVHDRVLPLSETIQLGLLDRFDLQPELVIEEPTFDDRTPQFDLAEKAKNQPLLRNERRELLGLDPLPDYGPDGEPLGLAIDLPVGLVVVGQGEEPATLTPGRFTHAPAPAPEPVMKVLPPIMPPALPANVPEPAKAGGPSRTALVGRFEPTIRKAVATFLASQRSEIAARVREKGEHLSRKPSDSRAWWDSKWDARLLNALKQGVAGLSATVASKVQGQLGEPKKADVFTDSVVDAILNTVGTRVSGINITTRDAIAAVISEGFAQGLSPAEVADLIESSTTFDAARAELIARTETATAYNNAALESYRAYDVSRVEVIDGDSDDVCASANGSVWSLEEAQGDPLGHPNCVRDFSPVFA